MNDIDKYKKDQKDSFDKALKQGNRIRDAFIKIVKEEDQLIEQINRIIENISEQGEEGRVKFEKLTLLLDEIGKKADKLRKEWPATIMKMAEEYKKIEEKLEKKLVDLKKL